MLIKSHATSISGAGWRSKDSETARAHTTMHQGIDSQGYVGQLSFAAHQIMQAQQYMGSPPPGQAMNGVIGAQGGYRHRQNSGNMMYEGGRHWGEWCPDLCLIEYVISRSSLLY